MKHEAATPQRIQDPQKIVGTILTKPTVERIFEMFTVRQHSARQICKRFGLRTEHVEGALRYKVIELRQAQVAA